VDAGFEGWARARTPTLLRAAYVLTGSQHAAEDLAQVTLERVATAWRRVEDPDAYARQVMYRVQVSSWRRRRVTETSTDAVPERGAPDLGEDAALRLTLGTALRRLTMAQRSVLVLRFYEDLSEADTAAVLGCTVGTVKSQTAKALSRLRCDPALAGVLAEELTR